MKRPFSSFVRNILVLMVFLAVLPALLIILYSGLEMRQAALEDTKREVMTLARTVGEVQQGISLSTDQMLSALAQMEAVRSRDGEAASAIFHSIIDENPRYSNIVATDIHGDVFASGKPFEPTSLADRPHFQQALEEKSFVVGEYILTRVGQEVSSLVFAYAVTDGQGEVLCVLSTAFNLDSFSFLLDVADFPEDSFLAVTDRNGIRLFYHPPRETTNPIGEPIVGTAWETAKGAREPGISVHSGSDGMRRIFAYQPVSLEEGGEPYAYIWSGIPEAAALKIANRVLVRNLLWMLLAAGMAFCVAWLVGGRRLLDPIQRLTGTTRAFASGNTGVRTGMQDAPGELGELAGAFDDMADTLVKNQQRLHTIADYTYDWEYWIGPDGELLWMSPSCERMTGRPASAFMADNGLIWRIVHEQDKPRFRAHLEERDLKRRGGHVDFRIVNVSGKTVWIDHHCIPIYDENGAFLGRRVSNRDITDRKRMEQSLAESEAQFRSLVEGAPDAIFVQTEFRFAYVNQAAIDLFGARSADQLLGTPVLDRFHPDFREAAEKRISQLNALKQKVPRLRQVYLRLDGSEVPVEVSAVPVTFEGKDGALVFVQDVTEREKVAARLQQAQKMEAVGALAGGIAHDFNNILFPIMGLSEMLLDDLPEKSTARDNAAEIYRAAGRARDLVNQILNFSRQAEHKKIPLRIQMVLKEVLKLSRATIPSNIVIHRDIASDMGPVLADPTNIHQVVMNLVTNAYHAVEETGGGITIALHRTELGPGDLSNAGLEPGAYALIAVSDTGCGIPPEIMPRIFEPYFTTKGQEKGTGLGLSVVFGIVREHGGDIRVYSEPGQGTAFRVYLPLMPREASKEAADKPAIYPSGTERILLVDDEEPIVRLETLMLERLGYRVSAYTVSEQALEAFAADPGGFDLVITDMAMPSMTGIRLAQRLVAIRPDMPVILSTGFSDAMTREELAENGIREILHKPITRGDLANTIRRVLDTPEE